MKDKEIRFTTFYHYDGTIWTIEFDDSFGEWTHGDKKEVFYDENLNECEKREK